MKNIKKLKIYVKKKGNFFENYVKIRIFFLK